MIDMMIDELLHRFDSVDIRCRPFVCWYYCFYFVFRLFSFFFVFSFLKKKNNKIMMMMMIKTVAWLKSFAFWHASFVTAFRFNPPQFHSLLIITLFVNINHHHHHHLLLPLLPLQLFRFTLFSKLFDFWKLQANSFLLLLSLSL